MSDYRLLALPNIKYDVMFICVALLSYVFYRRLEESTWRTWIWWWTSIFQRITRRIYIELEEPADTVYSFIPDISIVPLQVYY